MITGLWHRSTQFKRMTMVVVTAPCAHAIAHRGSVAGNERA